MARVMSRGVGRVREGLHPRSDSGVAPVESDVGEKVFSGPWNPRSGDEATCFECGRVVVQVLDDEVEDLWWEGAQHGGFREGFH